VRVDRFHDVPDITPGLFDVDNSGVRGSRYFDEREEVVVERHQNPVVLDYVRKVFPVGIAQSLFVTSVYTVQPRRRSPSATGIQILSSQYSGLMP